MARLEWAFVETFDAEEAPVLDPEALAGLSPSTWETARLVLSPATALLSVRYPVAELRSRLRAGDGSKVPIPEPDPQHLCVYRARDLSLHHATIGGAAHALLEALRRGAPLLAACEQAASSAPGAGAEIEAGASVWFSDWARRGIIARVEAP
jgi:hypothetical protein